MKLLIANRHLKGLGGSETFTYTLIAELQRQGHDVEYFTLHKGITSSEIEKLGISFSKSTNYDLIIAGQMDTITALRSLHFTGPLIQICHGCLTPGEQPHPEANGYIAISEEVQKHLQTKRITAPVILNGIDCNRFKTTRKPNQTLKVIASLAQTDEANDMIQAAADRIGVQVIRMNKYQDKIWEVERQLNRADMVVSLGRGCYEAMACGRPVVIFDKRKYQAQFGDGYLFPSKFDKYVKNNCSGRSSGRSLTVDDLVNEIQNYHPDHGAALRIIAIEKLNIEIQSQKILNACDPFLKKGTTDVVYILGTGSTWGNNEIRFSIRSFVKYFKELRNIVIVGECPAFLKDVIHIPCADKAGVNKDARMMIKIMAACKDGRVSDNFVLCTDDTLLLSPLQASDFKGWHDGPIKYDAVEDLKEHQRFAPNPKIKAPSAWFEYVYNTGRELQSRGLPDNNYDRAHSPQPINKAEFIEVMKTWDMYNTRYTVSNAYNNSTKIFTGENITGKNLKLYSNLTLEKIEELTKDKLCMNFNDNALNSVLKAWLYSRFSEPSPAEIFITDPDRRKTVQDWFKNGCNYEQGVEIFKYFAPKNKHLIKFLENRHNNEITDKKLKYTLQLWLR